MKHSIFAIIAAVSADLALAAPVVQSCQMTQGPGNRIVTINYVLSEYPAVVTLDVQTNCTENAIDKWVSIGGEHIWNAQGAVWRKVTSADLADGKFTITWDPTQSWTDETGKGFVVDGVTRKARAVVTAWPLDNTPDYMVVDVSSGAKPNTQRYYQAKEFLPGSVPGQTGAVTNNTAYKTSMLVMRKIMAKDVTWTMGTVSSGTYAEKGIQNATREASHQVALTNNYYIGVYEVTQQQWANIATNSSATAKFTWTENTSMRPMEQVCYNEIRLKANSNAAASDAELEAYSWPKSPAPASALGLLNLKTGLDFDLPSEAEWEFAARAGHGAYYWNDGSTILGSDSDANFAKLARHLGNNSQGGTDSPASSVDPALGGTAIVGSYLPNSWGLYDMHGNVYEWTLDWQSDDITGFNGRVNINPANPKQTLANVNGSNRWVKGGSCRFGYARCRPAHKNNFGPTTRSFHIGFRVVCRAGLK